MPTHVSLNAERLDTYERLRAEIMKYAERIQVGGADGGAAPMEVDALTNGFGKYGKGQSEVAFNNCGKRGHHQADCWEWRKTENAKSKSDQNGKGKRRE